MNALSAIAIILVILSTSFVDVISGSRDKNFYPLDDIVADYTFASPKVSNPQPQKSPENLSEYGLTEFFSDLFASPKHYVPLFISMIAVLAGGYVATDKKLKEKWLLLQSHFVAALFFYLFVRLGSDVALAYATDSALYMLVGLIWAVPLFFAVKAYERPFYVSVVAILAVRTLINIYMFWTLLLTHNNEGTLLDAYDVLLTVKLSALPDMIGWLVLPPLIVGVCLFRLQQSLRNSNEN